MKKLRKLSVALLAAALLFSLAVPSLASAVPLVDPNECPYCGIGTYITGESCDFYKLDTVSTRTCIHYGAPYVDKYIQRSDFYKNYCTNDKCSMHAPKYYAVPTLYWDCMRYGGTGMSIDGEIQ